MDAFFGAHSSDIRSLEYKPFFPSLGPNKKTPLLAVPYSNSTMDIGKSNTATISAADLLLSRAERMIISSDSSLKTMRAALIPLFGIQRNKQIICAIATNRLNSLLQMLRNRSLGQSTYDKLSSLWQDAFHISTARPPEWLLWIPLIRRFRLNDRFSWTTLYETLPFLHLKGYSSPGNLDILTSSVFESTFAGTNRLSELRALRGAARAVFAKNANEDAPLAQPSTSPPIPSR